MGKGTRPINNSNHLTHPDPAIEQRARDHYQNDPETKRLVDDLFATGTILEEEFVYVPQGLLSDEDTGR